MPTHDFTNVGEVLDFQILKGKITVIDPATDTCTVTVAGSDRNALIFYHCRPNSIARENGAIEGAATGFSVGDEVIVMINSDDSVVKVIGHIDGIRSCGNVILISATKSYKTYYNISTKNITTTGDLEEFTDNFTKFHTYFIPTWYDIPIESCNYIHGNIANVSDDPEMFYLPEFCDHKLDWHSNCFYYTGYLIFRNSPSVGVFPYDQTYHFSGVGGGLVHGCSFSFSQFTYERGRYHINRCINNEKRAYFPGEILLLKDNSENFVGAEKYLMTSPPRSPSLMFPNEIHGKRGYSKILETTEDGTKRLINSTYNEHFEVGGYFAPTVNCSDNSANPIMMYWPWIPYMHEVSALQTMGFSPRDEELGMARLDALLGSCSFWKFAYEFVSGVAPSEERYRDEATYYADPQVTNTADPITGGPVGVWIPPGGLVLIGGFSGEYTHGQNTPVRNWSFLHTHYFPISPVGNLLDLHIVTSLTGEGSMKADEKYVGNKSGSMCDGFPGEQWYFPEFDTMGTLFWPIGSWTDVSDATITTTESQHNNMDLTQKLMFGGTEIDSGSGSFRYLGDVFGTVVCNTSYTIEVYWEPGFEGNLWYKKSRYSPYPNGTRQDDFLAHASATRSLVVFEVLDYDSKTDFMKGTDYVHAVVVVYKRITISHNMTRVVHNTDSGVTAALRYPQSMPIIDTSSNTATNSDTMPTNAGTRQVEYVLYTNIGGVVTTKVLETVTVSADYPSVTVEGERAYGVSCKIAKGMVLVTYDRETFVGDLGDAQMPHKPAGAGPGTYYDSPLNYEDWNATLQGTALWEVENRIIYLFNPANSAEFTDECEPIEDEVYGITMNGNLD